MNRRGDRILGRRAHGGVLLVPCLLNDAYRYWFLVDTGAARTLLTPQVVEDLGLDYITSGHQERIASIHHIAWAPVVRVHSLQIGAQRLTAVDALVLSLPAAMRLDGLLGVNVLERFRATFEFDRATMILR